MAKTPRRFAFVAMTAFIVCGCALTCKDGPPALHDAATMGALIPRELNKVIMPDYVIEPPDILTIDAVTVVPKQPYKLRVLDILLVTVSNAPAQAPPIDGQFTIELDGTVRFGSPYDDARRASRRPDSLDDVRDENPFELEAESDANAASDDDDAEDTNGSLAGPVKVAGLTLEAATALIRTHLGRTLNFSDASGTPKLRVSLGQIGGQQQISGEHLVAPDGTVNLGVYGRVLVTGLTVQESAWAIEDHLSDYLESPEVSVDVFSYNSKVYYIILEGAGLGDRVARYPVTGNETVLDAIAEVEGLTSVSSKRIWIARPGCNVTGGHQTLPVDWAAITKGGDVRTNYQVLPGDRIFVEEDHLVAFDTYFGKLFSPVERALGLVLLGVGTAQRIDFYDQAGTAGGAGGGAVGGGAGL